MSFKLQDAIQKIKGIPGRYKRVLLSAASHARKDGSNIYASKETLGGGAGVSRWTAYRNIDPLVEMGILVEADSHTCANPRCPKGSKHSTGRGNHWTQAYNIDLVALQNATWESKKSRSKMQQSGVAKCLTSGVAKCDANRGIREARSTGSDEPSVLTDGSEKESKPVSLATTSLASPASRPASQESQNLSGFDGVSPNQSQKQNQPLLPQTRAELFAADLGGGLYSAADLLYKISPNVTDAMVKEQLPLCARILEFFPVREEEYRVAAAELVLKWNRAHRSGKYASKDDKKLYIRTAAQFLKALESENAFLLNDYDSHDFKNCETCKAAGVFDYKEWIRNIREEEQRQAEQREKDEREAAAEAARRAERERLDKLCPECRKNEPGKHMAYRGGGGGWVKVCDRCYDSKYEYQQSQLDMGKSLPIGMKPLEPRPDYLEAKRKAEAEAIAKKMDEAECDVPICLECAQVTFHAQSCSKNPRNYGGIDARITQSQTMAVAAGFDREKA